MTTKQQNETQEMVSPAAATTDRLPYIKPAFSSESVFETMALACGKVRGQSQDQCRRVASNS